MTEPTPTEPTPTEPTPTEPTPTEPTPPEATSPEATPPGPTSNASSPRGLKGWLARRAEAMLHKPRRALPALTEPGECHVVLQVTGDSPVAVITIISEATGLDFLSANTLARDAPTVVVSGISETSAERVVKRLKKAGARAVVGERYLPQ